MSRDNPWVTLSSRQVYDNPWIGVAEHQVLTPARTPGIYGTVHLKNLALGVVPVDHAGHTWLVGQWRYPLGRYSWEIPEGGGAHDVEPRDSAARELREETGLEAHHWLEIQRLDLSNSVTDERAVLFLAWGLRQGDAQPDEDERLEIRRVALSEAFRMVAEGEITDAMSVAALQRLRIMAACGELPPGLEIA